MADGAKLRDHLTPLVVDMDGTLLRGDSLFENIAATLGDFPAQTVKAFLSLAEGRAALKRRIADIGAPDVEMLPLNDAFVEFLHAEKAKGRNLHLATAADHQIAELVAERLGLFESVIASRDGRNLKGAEKRAALCERFPEGFCYAGDSRADLAVWKQAKGAVLVSAPRDVAARVRQSGVPVEAEFPRERNVSLRDLLRAARVHQWAKNIILFAPLFLAHAYGDLSAVLRVLLGFFILGIAASGAYLINDLTDLAADRRHRSKRERPFASGLLPVEWGLIGAPLMIAGGLGAGFALNASFGFALFAYLATTLVYSFELKKVALLDVFLLSMLYSLRLLMGVALVGVVLSPWLGAFSFFFFYSLSLAKRHVELINARDLPADQNIPGRGYRPADWPLTLALGAASTASSVMIIVIYITQEAFPSGAYSSPDWLWAAPVLITLWTQRIWLLAQRGELDDDPVAFAVRDSISILLGGLLAIFFALATIL